MSHEFGDRIPPDDLDFGGYFICKRCGLIAFLSVRNLDEGDKIRISMCNQLSPKYDNESASKISCDEMIIQGIIK